MGLNGVDFVLIGLMDGTECIHALRLERLGGWRVHLERVYRRAVLPYAEVEVRACRAACRADIADDFTLADTLADLEPLGIFREVQICSRIY